MPYGSYPRSFRLSFILTMLPCAFALLCYGRYDTRGCESDGQDFARVAAQGHGNQPLVRTYHNLSRPKGPPLNLFLVDLSLLIY